MYFAVAKFVRAHSLPILLRNHNNNSNKMQSYQSDQTLNDEKSILIADFSDSGSESNSPPNQIQQSPQNLDITFSDENDQVQESLQLQPLKVIFLKSYFWKEFEQLLFSLKLASNDPNGGHLEIRGGKSTPLASAITIVRKFLDSIVYFTWGDTSESQRTKPTSLAGQKRIRALIASKSLRECLQLIHIYMKKLQVGNYQFSLALSSKQCGENQLKGVLEYIQKHAYGTRIKVKHLSKYSGTDLDRMMILGRSNYFQRFSKNQIPNKFSNQIEVQNENNEDFSIRFVFWFDRSIQDKQDLINEFERYIENELQLPLCLMLQFPIKMQGHVKYLEDIFEKKIDKSFATTYRENKGQDINILIIGKGSSLQEVFQEISNRQIEESVPIKIIIKLENYLTGANTYNVEKESLIKKEVIFQPNQNHSEWVLMLSEQKQKWNLYFKLLKRLAQKNSQNNEKQRGDESRKLWQTIENRLNEADISLNCQDLIKAGNFVKAGNFGQAQTQTKIPTQTKTQIQIQTKSQTQTQSQSQSQSQTHTHTQTQTQTQTQAQSEPQTETQLNDTSADENLNQLNEQRQIFHSIIEGKIKKLSIELHPQYDYYQCKVSIVYKEYFNARFGVRSKYNLDTTMQDLESKQLLYYITDDCESITSFAKQFEYFLSLDKAHEENLKKKKKQNILILHAIEDAEIIPSLEQDNPKISLNNYNLVYPRVLLRWKS